MAKHTYVHMYYIYLYHQYLNRSPFTAFHSPSTLLSSLEFFTYSSVQFEQFFRPTVIAISNFRFLHYLYQLLQSYFLVWPRTLRFILLRVHTQHSGVLCLSFASIRQYWQSSLIEVLFFPDRNLFVRNRFNNLIG